MKKFISLLMAVCMTVTLLAACGSTSKEPAATPAPSENPAPAETAAAAPAEKEKITLKVWAEAAKASREYLTKACHPVSGMNAEYAEFDGSPMSRKLPWTQDRHDWFYSDAYRTAANIGLDYEWYKKDVGQRIAAERLQYCLGVTHKENPFRIFEIDGTALDEKALHPVAIVATTAQAALAVEGPLSLESADEAKRVAAQWVERFWEEPMRTGDRRYYDNCLYMFAFLALSGNYRIW